MESATAQFVSTPKNHVVSSQVHSIETSVVGQLPLSYAEYRRAKVSDEYQHAEALYKELDNRDGKNRLSQLRECRQYAYFARHKSTGKIRVISNSCRLRWCPICAQARRAFISREVGEWLHHIYRPKFLTLTLSHSNIPLSEQIRALYCAFRIFRRYKSLQHRIRGGVWFFQIKRGEGDKLWHPHLHIALDSDFIDKKALSVDWLRATGTSYIIDIEEIKNEREVSDYDARYCSKPSDLSRLTKDDRFEVATVLHGKRLCGRFGSGRKCDFKPRRYEEPSPWERLGSWYNFVNDRPFSRAIQKILQSWNRDESVEYGLCKDFIHEENPDASVMKITIEPRIHRQLYIDDFVHR